MVYLQHDDLESADAHNTENVRQNIPCPPLA